MQGRDPRQRLSVRALLLGVGVVLVILGLVVVANIWRASPSRHPHRARPAFVGVVGIAAGLSRWG
jgi:hypothetical protein